MKLTDNQILQQAIDTHKEGKYDVAEKLYREILKVYPMSPEVNNNLGALLYSLGRLVEAEMMLKKTIELKPGYADAYNNLANVQKGLDRLDEAEKNYKKAIELNPKFAYAFYNLGLIKEKLNKLDEAEKNYKKAIELNPDYVDAYNNLGAILMKLNRTDEAEVICYKTIELNPIYAEAYNNLGNVLVKLRRLVEAETVLKKAIELKPDYAGAYNSLGNIQHKLTKLAEAKVSYNTAIQLKPDYADAYSNLGITLMKLGKDEEACMIFKKAIEIMPNNILANNNLDILLKQKTLLNLIKENKSEQKNKLNFFSKVCENLFNFSPRVNSSTFGKRLAYNPFISNRDVESELITSLYKISSKKLDKTNGIFFGNGRHSSNWDLFKNNNSIFKKVEQDLLSIMKIAVKSEVFIMESFFNILSAGGGSTPHTHTIPFDYDNKLHEKKFSLQYYLSVGDQDSREPGIFKLKDPEEEILPLKGMVMIIPADRMHSAVYNGKEDRIMIGINFYSLA